jgi:hypothetical protein
VLAFTLRLKRVWRRSSVSLQAWHRSLQSITGVLYTNGSHQMHLVASVNSIPPYPQTRCVSTATSCQQLPHLNSIIIGRHRTLICSDPVVQQPLPCYSLCTIILQTQEGMEWQGLKPEASSHDFEEAHRPRLHTRISICNCRLHEYVF